MSPPRKRAEIDRLAREQAAELGRSAAPTERLQSADIKPTERLPSAYAAPTERLQSSDGEPMKEYRVRLPEGWWRELERRGSVEGLKPSQLVRRLVGEFLRDRGGRG